MPWLEKHIEDNFVRWVDEYHPDFVALKAKMFRKGWPDRLIIGKGPTMYFIEFKKPGEEPRKIQKFVFNILRQWGFDVYVCTSTEQAEEIFRTYL